MGAQRGLFDEVEELFNEMRRRHLEPDVVTFTSVINAKAQLGRFDEVVALFREMQALSLRPNEYTFNSIICAQALRGEFDVVHSLYTQMKDMGLKPDLKTFHPIINSYIREGFLTTAKECLQHMRSECQLSDVDFHSIIIKYHWGDLIED